MYNPGTLAINSDTFPKPSHIPGSNIDASPNQKNKILVIENIHFATQLHLHVTITSAQHDKLCYPKKLYHPIAN